MTTPTQTNKRKPQGDDHTALVKTMQVQMPNGLTKDDVATCALPFVPDALYLQKVELGDDEKVISSGKPCLMEEKHFDEMFDKFHNAVEEGLMAVINEGLEDPESKESHFIRSQNSPSVWTEPRR